MDEILERVKANRPALERWLRALPGYAGYKEKELRRDADRLLREALSRRLREAADRLLRAQRRLADRDLSRVEELDRLVRRLQTLADRIRTAGYGYAGFFDALRIEEAELEALYRFDAELLERAEELPKAVEALEQAVEGSADLSPALRGLEQPLQALEAALGSAGGTNAGPPLTIGAATCAAAGRNSFQPPTTGSDPHAIKGTRLGVVRAASSAAFGILKTGGSGRKPFLQQPWINPPPPWGNIPDPGALSAAARGRPPR
jgi:hypothetical protein